jgi:hypothetical protein
MKFQAVNLNEQVVTKFGLDNCVAVATRLVSPQGVMMHRNKRPAQDLFNDIDGFEESGQGYVLTKKSVPVAYIEPGVGAKYRHFNDPVKEKATVCTVLTEGAKDELYFANTIVNVTTIDGVATIVNDTVLNGIHWSLANNITDVHTKGCMWMINGVQFGKQGTYEYITNGNVFNFNTGSGRLGYAVVSKAPVTEGDYNWSLADQKDSDDEFLSLVFYVGVKDTLAPCFVPLKQIL